MSDKNGYMRWYDHDEILSKAVKVLETSEDNLQIQVALNLIKVIVEHNIDNNRYSSVDEIIASVESEQGNSRWYDLDNTIRTAIQLLKSCSKEELQGNLAHDIASIVTDALNKFDTDEESDLI